ncbi:hypothetical protein GGR69_003642 [Xanthomonas arboricola]|nr:hypothetical protein [Xanthomonas arboricola]
MSATILKAVLADISVCRRELRHHSTQQLFNSSIASLTELRHEQRRNLVPPQDHAMLKNLRCGECARLLCKAGVDAPVAVRVRARAQGRRAGAAGHRRAVDRRLCLARHHCVDKTEGVRPQLGRCRNQAEHIVWGSKGNMPLDRRAPVLPGGIRESVRKADKHHLTGKPADLMRQLVKICETGGRILDPSPAAARHW